MIKYFNIYIVFIAILSSCGQNTIINPTEKEQKVVSDNYSFVDIEYIVNEFCHSKNIIRKYDPITINNNTSSTQIYNFYPQKNIFEVSAFWSSDSRAFSFVDDQQNIKVPIELSKSGDLIYDNGTRWIYSANEQKMRPEIGSYESISIKPNHKLILASSFHLKELTTSYKLHLKGVEFNEEITIDGQWSGVFFLDYEIDYRIEPIDYVIK
jgi:hypothetical protein